MSLIQNWSFNSNWSSIRDTFNGFPTWQKVAAVSAISMTCVCVTFHFIRKKNGFCRSEYVRDKEANLKSLDVAGGAKIYWNEYGAVETGFPVLVFHGGMTCHLEGILSEKVATKYNLRLIVVDRPGCGQSTFPSVCDGAVSDLPSLYPLSSYMQDIRRLLSHLKINDHDYGVAGSSHSGLHAWSSVYYLKPKFVNIFVGCPLATRKYFTENRDIVGADYISGITRSNCWFPVRFQHNIIRFLVLYCKSLMIAMCRFQAKHEHPRNTYNDEIDEATGISSLEALYYMMFKSCEHGIEGTLYTSQLLNENWGFDLDKDVDQAVKKELKICLYHGQNDTIVPCDFVKHHYQNYLINECKFENVEFNMYEGCGHWLNTDIWDNAYKRTREFIDNGK